MPTFTWLNKASPLGVPLLRITFPDGGEDDVAVLKEYNPIPMGPSERSSDVDRCIYSGILGNEKDVDVTLTGCAMSDNFQVISLV